MKRILMDDLEIPVLVNEEGKVLTNENYIAYYDVRGGEWLCDNANGELAQIVIQNWGKVAAEFNITGQGVTLRDFNVTYQGVTVTSNNGDMTPELSVYTE